MQKTTNYKFKKPELTDSPPDITVLNENFDIIDEKLFAVIKAWEDFKANGGAIGGAVTFEGETSEDYSLRINGRVLEAIGEGLAMKAPNCQTLFYYYNIVAKKSALIPETTLNTLLGQSDRCFAESWVGTYRHEDTGYTSLNNTFIIQWGRIKTPDANNYLVTYPIGFPNKCLGLVISIDSTTMGRAISQNIGQYNFRVVTDSSNDNASIMWFAIGH